MSISILEQTLHGLLTDRCTAEVIRSADRGEWQQPLWDALADAGMTRVGLPEAQGGSGGDLADALTVIRVAGFHAAPLPIIETSMLGGWVLAQCGQEIPIGPIAVALPDISGRLIAGWARYADRVVVVSRDGSVTSYERDRTRIVSGNNLANEPRDRVDVTGTSPSWSGRMEEGVGELLVLRHALGRAAAIAGAAERVLAMTIQYAGEREQFGRPIANFQAVGQMLAVQAADVAAARAAVEVATRSLDALDTRRMTTQDELRIATAKARTSRAAAKVARIAHQVHGAIGFTDEHTLHLFTRRLNAWSDEAGSDHAWSHRLGVLANELDPDELWAATE